MLANEKDVQGLNMVLLDCYCALTYTTCCSSFLCVFQLCMYFLVPKRRGGWKNPQSLHSGGTGINVGGVGTLPYILWTECGKMLRES